MSAILFVTGVFVFVFSVGYVTDRVARWNK